VAKMKDRTSKPGHGGGHHHGHPSITDGSSNTIVVMEDGAIFVPGPRSGGGNIADGTSNTILLGEGGGHGHGRYPEDVPIDDGSVRTIGSGGAIGDGSVRNIGGAGTITDGSSNTILIGETGGAGPGGHPGGDIGGGRTITDGSSNTIQLGETGGRDGVPLPCSVHHTLCEGLDPWYLMRVRIHTGPEFHCAGLPGRPLAYIRGAEIHFAPGRYDPYTQSGRRLLKRVLTIGAHQHALGRHCAFGFRRNHEIGV
jgi:hypothetical protein